MRGEIFRYHNPEARGHQQAGPRYAVVVQSDDLRLSTVLVAPTSTRVRPAAFRAEVEILGQETLVLTEQLTAVNPERLGVSVGHLHRHELTAVDRCLRYALDLD